MPRNEHDFLQWTSFPSSAKMINDTRDKWGINWTLFTNMSVKPNSKLRVIIQAKQKGMLGDRHSHLALKDGKTGNWVGLLNLPQGVFDWRSFDLEVIVPADVQVLSGYLAVAPDSITWFDDLKIYLDDTLIYSDDFSNWAPIIIPAEIITGVAIIKYIK